MTGKRSTKRNPKREEKEHKNKSQCLLTLLLLSCVSFCFPSIVFLPCIHKIFYTPIYQMNWITCKHAMRIPAAQLCMYNKEAISIFSLFRKRFSVRKISPTKYYYHTVCPHRVSSLTKHGKQHHRQLSHFMSLKLKNIYPLLTYLCISGKYAHYCFELPHTFMDHYHVTNLTTPFHNQKSRESV